MPLLVAPVTACLIGTQPLDWRPEVLAARAVGMALALQAVLATAIALWCRPMLRGMVRFFIGGPSRHVFEGFWAADGKLVPSARDWRPKR
jgi:hypothetical protein